MCEHTNAQSAIRKNICVSLNTYFGKTGQCLHLEHSVCFILLRSVLCLSNRENQTFAATRPSSVLLEQVAVCVAKGEPVLLVGETGTGKTSTVQHLARVTGERRDAV